MRLLLAEDDPDLARSLRLSLAEAGYAVDLARDGEEAAFLGETEPYDLVVLDLGLPRLDGVSVLKRWRAATWSWIPVRPRSPWRGPPCD